MLICCMQLVFGGAGMHGTLGDLWLFNTKTGTWVTPMAEGQAPCQREMHSGVMLTDSRMLICGGRSAAGQVCLIMAVLAGTVLYSTFLMCMCRSAHVCFHPHHVISKMNDISGLGLFWTLRMSWEFGWCYCRHVRAGAVRCFHL